MWPMDISTGLDFAASPDDVYAMMTDQAYLEEVCVASESISYDASVTDSSTPDLAYAPGAGVGRPVHRTRAHHPRGDQLVRSRGRRITHRRPHHDRARASQFTCGGR